MQIIFFGSSQYSVIVAERLYKQFGLSLLVTKPGPVVKFAEKNNIPVITPGKLTPNFPILLGEGLSEVRPDFLIVADYGLILPKKILNLPKYAPINVHHSLLPKYRGPTPAPTAILTGEKITGVSIIKMEEKVDSGNILAQKTYEINPQETTDSLLKELNTLGSEILIPVIENFKEANIHAKKQDESQATYTPRLTRDSGYIDLSCPPTGGQLDRMIRAYYPWPSIWCKYQISNIKYQKEKIIKLLPASAYPDIVAKGKSSWDGGRLKQSESLDSSQVDEESRILLQVEGKKPMNYKDFINGYPKGRELLEKLKLI